MKRCISVMVAAVLTGAGAAAYAAPVVGQISISGYAEAIGSAGIGSATGLDFVQGPTGSASVGIAGGITSYGAGTGSFAGLACTAFGSACGTIKDIISFTTSPPISSFLAFNTNGPSISFDLVSITGVTHSMDATGGSVVLTAIGIIHFSGLDNTPGAFTLTAQGNQITSFSATTLAAAGAVPEPASIAILGGSLIALGLLRRRGM